jgi:hypothetical protein
MVAKVRPGMIWYLHLASGPFKMFHFFKRKGESWC